MIKPLIGLILILLILFVGVCTFPLVLLFGKIYIDTFAEHINNVVELFFNDQQTPL